MNTVPQMGERKRRYIERALLKLAEYSKPLRVLEWGSGGSTVYFTRFLRERGIAYEWISLEYDPKWFEKVRQELSDDAHTSLALFDTNGKEARRRDVHMDEYVNYPSTLGIQFDLIIVDGRKRRRCLLEARRLLSGRGVVFLDDAFRPYYWSAFRVYPDSRFIWFNFWQGSARHLGFLERLHTLIWNTLHKARGLLRFIKKRLLGKLR